MCKSMEDSAPFHEEGDLVPILRGSTLEPVGWIPRRYRPVADLDAAAPVPAPKSVVEARRRRDG
jgi:hypothetical protein